MATLLTAHQAPRKHYIFICQSRTQPHHSQAYPGHAHTPLTTRQCAIVCTDYGSVATMWCECIQLLWCVIRARSAHLLRAVAKWSSLSGRESEKGIVKATRITREPIKCATVTHTVAFMYFTYVAIDHGKIIKNQTRRGFIRKASRKETQPERDRARWYIHMLLLHNLAHTPTTRHFAFSTWHIKMLCRTYT